MGVLRKRSEKDWELYNQREKELKAKIKLQREKLKTKKEVVKRIGEKKREITEDDKLKAAKSRIEQQELEQQQSIEIANRDLETKTKIWGGKKKKKKKKK